MDTYGEVSERLSSVEAALAEFIIQSNRTLHILSREMKEFKDEMKEFKDEMKEFKDEMKEFKIRSEQDLKQYRQENQEFRRDMNKQWGALANKLGTIVEDIIAPAVRPAIKKYFGDAVSDRSVNRKKYDKAGSLKGEFDVIAVGESAVYIVETKLSPDKRKLKNFLDRVARNFAKLFPEYKHLPVVMIFASLSFEEHFVHFASQEGIFLMAYREWDYMDILNYEAVMEKRTGK